MDDPRMPRRMEMPRRDIALKSGADLHKQIRAPPRAAMRPTWKIWMGWESRASNVKRPNIEMLRHDPVRKTFPRETSARSEKIEEKA